jgi:hypothetical protein
MATAPGGPSRVERAEAKSARLMKRAKLMNLTVVRRET